MDTKNLYDQFGNQYYPKTNDSSVVMGGWHTRRLL